jgi:hypothetical protein
MIRCLKHSMSPLTAGIRPMCECSKYFLRLCWGGTLTVCLVFGFILQGVHGDDVSGPEKFQPVFALECVKCQIHKRFVLRCPIIQHAHR